MSAPTAELRKAAQLDIITHTAIFDLYVVLGRDPEQLAIKFGCDIPIVHTILTGYGEAIDGRETGRLPGLPRVLVEEYIAHFYPGIASENPQNDWITIDAYLDLYHPGWRQNGNAENHEGKTLRTPRKGRRLY